MPMLRSLIIGEDHGNKKPTNIIFENFGILLERKKINDRLNILHSKDFKKGTRRLYLNLFLTVV
jgi:hypothetical protein